MVTMSPGTHESTRSEVNSHSIVRGIRPASLRLPPESSCTLCVHKAWVGITVIIVMVRLDLRSLVSQRIYLCISVSNNGVGWVGGSRRGGSWLTFTTIRKGKEGFAVH